MSDWGMGATAKKCGALPKPQPKTYYDYQCVVCGMNYMTEIEVKGEYRCPNCRKTAPIHTPSPPPASVQMTIDDFFGTKK